MQILFFVPWNVLERSCIHPRDIADELGPLPPGDIPVTVRLQLLVHAGREINTTAEVNTKRHIDQKCLQHVCEADVF